MLHDKMNKNENHTRALPVACMASRGVLASAISAVRYAPTNTASTHWMGSASRIMSFAVEVTCLKPRSFFFTKNSSPV